MKLFITLLLFHFVFCSSAYSQTQMVPNSLGTTVTFLGPLANGQRTYQMLINANQLTGIVGQTLKGLTFRLTASASAAWPATEVTYTNYDIYLSESVAPASRSLTFASNVVGAQTQVRSGSLVIPAGSFTFGGTPNAFGSVINFTNTYRYNGGHLLVEIRHNGSTGNSTSTEANGTGVNGYATDFSACWTGSYTGTTGSQGNFCVTQFTYDAGLPLSLSSFKAVRRLQDANLQWSTASEQNTQHFMVERSTDGRQFNSNGTVAAAGNSNTTLTYQFTDKNIVSLGVKQLYYRLKMVDKDALYKYSPIATINIGKELSLISLYPNPVANAATLFVNAATAETVDYSIVTADGKMVQTGRYQFLQGNNQFIVNTAKLPAGNYYLRLQGVNISERVAFVK